MTPPQTLEQLLAEMQAGVPKGCLSCIHYECSGEGEYGGGPYSTYCNSQPHLHNLKSFPFKKQMPCHQMNFWFSEFAEEYGKPGDCQFDKSGFPIDSTSKAMKKYREKYFGDNKELADLLRGRK